MKTTEERVKLINDRVNQKKKTRRNNRLICLDCGVIAACIALIVLAGNGFAHNDINFTAYDGLSDSGMASMMVNGSTVEYVIIGILAFLLGIFTQILLTRIHKRNKDSSED